MTTVALAAKALARRKIRTLLTAAGVGVAVAVFVSLMGFNQGYRNALSRDVEKMGYQVLVTSKGCPYEAATMLLNGGQIPRYMDEKVVQRVISDPAVAQYTPFFMNAAIDPAAGATGLALFIGIDPTSFLAMKPWLRLSEGGVFSGETVNEALLGWEAAELQTRRVGDELFIPGTDRVLRVVGILKRSGTQDDGTIFVPLKTAQAMFKQRGKLTGLGLKLHDLTQVVGFEDRLFDEASIQVITMSQVKNTILSLVNTARVMVMSVAAVAIFVAVLGVVNTILFSVFERTREIGVMKAIGASHSDVFRVIWLETVMLCSAGGLLGIGLALAAGGVMQSVIRKVLPYAPSGNLVEVTPGLLAGALLGALFLGLVAGIYPSLRAAMVRPIQAIRAGVAGGGR